MRFRGFTALAVLTVACFALAGAARAGDKTDHSGHDHASHDHADDDAATQEAWAKAAIPGEHHQSMDYLVGKWKSKQKYYGMGPEPVEAEGTLVYEWAMGGRYLMGKYSSEMMGMPFEGMSIDGYDNITGEYFNVWLDNMGTGVLHSRGKKTDDATCELLGAMTDPMSGQEMTVRMVSKKTGDDSHTFTMYMTPVGEKEMLAMEVWYERVAS